MRDVATTDLLRLAERLATEATDIALDRLGTSPVARKQDDSVVTDVDHDIQAHILSAIATTFPDHAVCAEETLRAPAEHADITSARFCWVIDPLDGTRNYVSSFPCFATSIAVLDRGIPVAAVIVEHNLRRLFAASAGNGTTMNNQPIRVQAPPAQSDMIVATPSSKDELTVRVVQNWASTRGLILRNLGATTFHLALVACGALAGAFAKRAKLWDVAAGALLVTEAGGRITGADGSELLPFDLSGDPDADVPFLAAAPQAYERLLESIPKPTK